ncbi:MAG: hypothetical protein WCS77_06970 [Elusimicrobiaceae bacterium]|jgi:chromosome segregation ATPase
MANSIFSSFPSSAGGDKGGAGAGGAAPSGGVSPLQIKKLTERVGKMDEQLADLEISLKKREEVIAALEKKISGYESSEKAREDKLALLDKKISLAMAQAGGDLDNKIKTLYAMVSALNPRFPVLEKAINDTNDRVKAVGAALESFHRQIFILGEHDKRLASIDSALNGLTENLKRLETADEKTVQRFKQIEHNYLELEVLPRRIDKNEQWLSELKRETMSFGEQIGKIEGLRGQFSSVRDRFRELDETLKEHKNAFSECQKFINSVDESYFNQTSLTEIIERLSKEYSYVENQVSRIRQRTEDLEIQTRQSRAAARELAREREKLVGYLKTQLAGTSDLVDQLSSSPETDAEKPQSGNSEPDQH